jgi:mRNA interferase RelE/StbE
VATESGGPGASGARYRTVFIPAARDELRAIQRTTAMRILTRLGELEKDPYGLGTTALVSSPDRRRLRVGDYRVLYTVDGSELVVWAVHVRHRSTAYRGG